MLLKNPIFTHFLLPRFYLFGLILNPKSQAINSKPFACLFLYNGFIQWKKFGFHKDYLSTRYSQDIILHDGYVILFGL